MRTAFSIRKISLTASLAGSILALAAGYALAAQWPGAVLALAGGVLWLIAQKYPSTPLPLASLLPNVGLAAAGLLRGASPELMICAAGLTLAAWDLLLLDSTLNGLPQDDQTRRYERKHLAALAAALTAGLGAALAGRLVSIRIPFIVMLLLGGLTLLVIERLWTTLKKRNIRHR